VGVYAALLLRAVMAGDGAVVVEMVLGFTLPFFFGGVARSRSGFSVSRVVWGDGCCVKVGPGGRVVWG